MTQFRVASKMLKETEGEKCPKCLTIWQDFGKIEEHLWFCYSCGTVFVPKKVREPEKWGKKEQILRQVETMKEMANQNETTPFACPHCDFVAKSEFGLNSHMKKHKNERQ